MNENWAGQIEKDFIENKSLEAVESGRIGKAKKKLATLYRPIDVLWVEVKTDSRKVKRSTVKRKKMPNSEIPSALYGDGVRKYEHGHF
jgi:hypothetical protein